MQESVAGVIDHVIYRNEGNGYTVFSMISDGSEQTVVGTFEELSEGESIEVFGHFTEHAAYGRQFRADRYEIRIPETAEAIERYLGSGALKGIGRALAGRIVKKFGAETLQILEEQPERLAEVKGISLKKARDIGTQAAKQAGMRKAMIFLGNYGISLSLGIRIYNAYGDEMYTILRDNPYRMADEIPGVGFLTADRIAQAIGIAPESEFRVKSGILFVLMRAAADGSVYLPEDMLCAQAEELLGVGEEAIARALTGLAIDRKAVIKNHGAEDGETHRIVYSAQYFYLEQDAARMLVDLNLRMDESEEEVLANIRALEAGGSIHLAGEQLAAVRLAAMNGILILTGGPGTGKTTAINEMIRYFRREHKTVLLAAPTGRAAKRMTETTGYEASTIHRLLEISSGTDDALRDASFQRNRDNPLEADVVIIDEMSMVDIFLMHALLSAVTPGTRLILVGDVDQLPSVGAGAVLRDIIRSEAFPCVRLTKIFRQAAESDIVLNAHKINRGENISLDNHSRDFFFLARTDPNLIISNIIELVRDKLPRYVKASPAEIQVLAPMRKGALGVERLNRILQAYLNPQDGRKREKEYGDRVFREGDKVMQTRNNYQLAWEIRGKYDIPVHKGTGIFNGDMGVIREINDSGKYMSVEFDEGRMVDYPFDSLEDLEHAYAVTIHKSQGSEYPAVLLPVTGGPGMLMTRNLLYTAVTRARSCVVILGTRKAVRDMIENESERQRYTSLDERIREICKV